MCENRGRRPEGVVIAPVLKSVELPNQVRLPYAEQGDSSGVPVVLLHGLADSWHSFELMLAHLPESIHAFALTQRGHGDASRPETGYTVGDFAADLAALMDALELDRAVIAGASSGGLVALRFAIERPERTLALVLMGSPLTLRDKPPVLELWDSTISKLTDPLDPAFVREFQQSTLAKPVPQAFFETVVQESLKVPGRVWKEALEGFLQEDLSGELNNVAAPTLIVRGDRDAFLQSDHETLAAGIPGSRLVVYPNAGHTFYWEEPDRVASDLVAFIEGLGH